MESFNAILFDFENPVELLAELFVFIGVYVQRKNLGSFQARVSRPNADSRTPAFVLEQFLTFGGHHEVDE
jgi:hypothetical protein